MRLFFFNDTATTEIYTLSLHDALPICMRELRDSRFTASPTLQAIAACESGGDPTTDTGNGLDRKSTRLNSSHANISYAVFCLKKKKNFTIYLFTINLSVYSLLISVIM